MDLGHTEGHARHLSSYITARKKLESHWKDNISNSNTWEWPFIDILEKF